MEPEFTLEEMVRQIWEQLEEVGDRWTMGEITEALGLPVTSNNVSRVSKKVRNLIGSGQVTFVGKKLAKVLGGPMQGGYMRSNFCYQISEDALEELIRFFRPKEKHKYV